MSRSRTYRPRTTRENRERLEEIATQLNGDEPDEFHDSLTLVLNYLDVLNGDIESCPRCGAELRQERADLWHCWKCEEDRNNGYVTLWDAIQPDDEDNAEVPVVPRGAAD